MRNGRDRPAHDDEIKITKAMIEAGIDELVAWDSRFSGEDEAVCKIYRAMVKEAYRDKSAASEDNLGEKSKEFLF
jgi:hypothetical protein